MASFKKTHTRVLGKTGPKATPDSLYWKKLEFPVTVKEFTSIDYIDISPSEPYHIAVSSGPKVDVYHKETTQVWRTLSRFQRNAYGAKFRQDGQLLIVGTEEGPVKLFNQRQKQLLRVFSGHNGATHRVGFVDGTTNIVSFSDDKTAIIWDVGSESQVSKLTGHTDFIRAGIPCPTSDNIILSGSYDHTVKVWDSRTASSVLTVDHGAPVESLLCYPSGGVFVSAGGSEVRVWDVISGRLLSKLSQHHKTVTCLAFASNNKRIMSGSLDRHVKIYDVTTYSVVHTLDFPAPILSLAVAPEDSMLAVGMISGGSGLVSFQERRLQEKEKDSNRAKKKAGNIRNAVTEDLKILPDDYVITQTQREKMHKHDALLRKFCYGKALSDILRTHAKSKPHIVVTVMQELIRRGGLKTAVAGREGKDLHALINFIIKNIRHPMLKCTLMDVTEVILDVYSDALDENPSLLSQLRSLRKEVDDELRSTQEHISLMGAIEMFLAASSPEVLTSRSAPVTLVTEESTKLMPSSAAVSSDNLVVDVC